MTSEQRTFLQAYITAALWSSTDDQDRPLDGLGLELSDELTDRMTADCEEFQKANRDLYLDNGWTDEQAGHDFWLTRNHHGAGFWDRGLGEAGDILTARAQAQGECDLYVGDDGKVYV